MNLTAINPRAAQGVKRCFTLLVAFCMTGAGLASTARAVDGDDPLAGGTVLTNMSQVYQVGQEAQNRENVRVKFRGVLTYQDVFSEEVFFIQDETATVFTLFMPGTNTFAAGDVVEIEGVVIPGLYVPAVKAEFIRVVAHAALPTPKITQVAHLAAGEDFGKWVEIEATVRDVCCSKDRVVLACVDHGFHFLVWCTQKGDTPLPLELLDARVRLRGVSWTKLDNARRPVGFILHQPGTNCITVLQPGGADVFRGATQNISNLRATADRPDVRVKVTGVVTLASPAGWLCLQDETGTLTASLFQPIGRDEDPRGKFLKRNPPALVPGDRLELVGAVRASSGFAPVLTDAEFRRLGHRPPPAPRDVASGYLLTGKLDAELVRLKARVVDLESQTNPGLFAEKVWLQSDGATFEARLDASEPVRLAVQKNDFVQLTGICELQAGRFQQVHSFQLHLRGPADILVTRQPPWWSSHAALTLLASGGIALLAGFSWILLLRRQVALRTADLEEAQAGLHRSLAEEKELNRLKGNFISMVTHEIRTPLALILGSSEILSRYLDRLPPEKRAGHLTTIAAAVQRMSELLEDVLLFSKAEAGRMEFNPVAMDLKNFCTQLVDEIASATNQRCPIELNVAAITESARGDESLLRHVLSNLLTNAVKYSPPATPVTFSVAREVGDAVFIVQDRGLGIPADDRQRLFTPFYRCKNVVTIPGTGLGLVIVKHCVEQHGGTLEIESAEGHGTTVRVRLPLFSPAHTDFLKRLSQNKTE